MIYSCNQSLCFGRVIVSVGVHVSMALTAVAGGTMLLSCPSSILAFLLSAGFFFLMRNAHLGYRSQCHFHLKKAHLDAT